MEQDRSIFFEQHPDSMWVCDRASLRVLDANAAAIARYGFSGSEFLSLTLADLRAAGGNSGDDACAGERHAERHRMRSGEMIDVDVTARDIEYRGHEARLIAARDVTPIVASEREARAAAQASAERFKALFEAVPGKVLVLTVAPHRIVAVSDSYVQTTGFSRDFLAGKLLAEAFPDNPADPRANGLALLLASLRRVTGSGVADVMPLVRYSVGPRDGSPGQFEERFWSAVNSPILDSDGTVAFIINRVEDVTDLVNAGQTQRNDPDLRFGMELMIRAEELQVANSRLQEKTFNLRTAQRLMRVSWWKGNLATGRLSWSEDLCDMFGVDRSTLGDSFDSYLRLVHPDDLSRFEAVYRDVLAAGPAVKEFAHRVIRPAGDTIHVKGMLEVSELAEGKVVYGVLRDVTSEVAGETLLRQAESLARFAGKIAKLGAWRLDYDPQRITWSDETAAIHDEPPGFAPNLEEGLNYYTPEARARIAEAVDDCYLHGTPFDEVLQLVTARGNLIWVRSIGEPDRDAEGRIVAVQGAFQDVTEVVAMRSKTDALAKRLADTLESMNEAFLTLDRDWRFSYVNRQAERTLGMPRDFLLGRNVWTGEPDAPLSGLKPALQEAVQTQSTVRLPQYFSRTLKRWFEINAHPNPEGIGIYFRDITDEVGRIEQLRLLEKSVSHLNDMLIITEAWPHEEPDGPKIVYVNEAFTRITGYSSEEVIGRTPQMLQGPATQQAVLDRIRQAIRRGQPAMEELINYTSGGKEYWVELFINPVADENGKVTHMVSVQRDVTGRKRAEQALRQSEERFRLVSNATSAVVWDSDLENRTVWFNTNLTALFGYPDDSFGANLENWHRRIHDEDRERVLAGLRAAIDGDALTWQDEFRFLRFDGSVATVADRGHIIRDETGKAVRMVGSFIDVTEEKLDAARKRQSQKLEAMGQLTGGVAHDFNNLLTVILGNAEMLMETVTDPKLRQMAEMTVSAAERGAALTGRLLAFARKQPLEPQPIDMTERVAEMGGLLRRTLAEDIEISYRPSHGLWKVDVDANQLEVALLNLVLNARDAMPDGGKLTIETANVHLDKEAIGPAADSAPGDYVRLTVTDTGTGMPPEVLERAFEPFFTTKHEGRGSGLGLSLVYGFVTQSGGFIRTFSEPGAGSSFRLYFPRSQSGAARARRGQRANALVGGSEHILVVEDDDHVRDHLVSLLELLGYRVTFATNGLDALDIVKKGEVFDLLLTDVIMPGGMNGRQLADAARRVCPELRVLFTSGYTEDAIVHDGRLDPGVDLLSKPYRRQVLARKVRKVLDEPAPG